MIMARPHDQTSGQHVHEYRFLKQDVHKFSSANANRLLRTPGLVLNTIIKLPVQPCVVCANPGLQKGGSHMPNNRLSITPLHDVYTCTAFHINMHLVTMSHFLCTPSMSTASMPLLQASSITTVNRQTNHQRIFEKISRKGCNVLAAIHNSFSYQLQSIVLPPEALLRRFVRNAAKSCTAIGVYAHLLVFASKSLPPFLPGGSGSAHQGRLRIGACCFVLCIRPQGHCQRIPRPGSGRLPRPLYTHPTALTN